MDGTEIKRSYSFETLVNQNIANVAELKVKLNEIIKIGKDYNKDIVSCMKILLKNNDSEIVCLTLQAIAEISKCENKRMQYAQEDFVKQMLVILEKRLTEDNLEILKQCCRALGNMCCDCDTTRKYLLKYNGVNILISILKCTLNDNSVLFAEIQLLVCKCLLNFAIGGQEMSNSIFEAGIVEHLHKILKIEIDKEDMNDDITASALLLLSVINENSSNEFLFSPEVNSTVLKIMKETMNIGISELCLEHLHLQAEHDSVKSLLAREGCLQLVCSRLELLVNRHSAGDLNATDSEVDNVINWACDLTIIILTGDDAINILYNNGVGEVYLTMVKWLDSSDYNLLTTAVLAIGNFARKDEYCIQMMEDKIFDKLLDLFEIYYGFGVRMMKEPNSVHPIDEITVTKVQHALLSALRNLVVPLSNKRVAAANGKAAPVLLNALPNVKDHHVAYKMLAAVRMLVDGQEAVAKQFAENAAALEATVRWGHAVEFAGAAGEAPRLIAWSIKQLRHSNHWRYFIEVDGCITCLVNMLVSSHSVMQNEAILAITLLAMESLRDNKKSPQFEIPPKINYENKFISELVKSEIGKHISVLIDTNCAKMPVEVGENMLAFLDVTVKKKEVAADYKEAKVNESLLKFSESRKDFNEDIQKCILAIASIIADSDKLG